jgi:hypothetical protein
MLLRLLQAQRELRTQLGSILLRAIKQMLRKYIVTRSILISGFRPKKQRIPGGQSLSMSGTSFPNLLETRKLSEGTLNCAGNRAFYSEVTVSEQPLLTTFPAGDARLPLELAVFDKLDLLDSYSIPNIPISCLTAPKIGGFGRMAQATSLLDRVRKGLAVPNVDSRLLLL